MSAKSQSQQTELEQQKGQDHRFVTTPALKPVLGRLGVTVVGSLAILALFLTHPQLLGTVEVTNVAFVLVQFVIGIAIVRLIIKLIILRNTKYILTDETVRREYSLLGRTKVREIPYSLIRSYEQTQNRIEYLLGMGSIAINQGLGKLVLRNAPDPDRIYELVQERVE